MVVCLNFALSLVPGFAVVVRIPRARCRSTGGSLLMDASPSLTTSTCSKGPVASPSCLFRRVITNAELIKQMPDHQFSVLFFCKKNSLKVLPPTAQPFLKMKLSVRFEVMQTFVLYVLLLIVISTDLMVAAGCFYSNTLGGLKCYENPKNKVTAVPADEEEICGATFQVKPTAYYVLKKNSVL